MKAINILWTFLLIFGAPLSHGQGLFLLKQQGWDNDNQAVPVEYKSADKFSTVCNIVTASGQIRRLNSNLIVEDIDYATLAIPENIQSGESITVLKNTIAKIEATIKQWPKTKPFLLPYLSAAQSAELKYLSGNVKLGSRWITRAEYSKEMEQAELAAELEERKLVEAQRERRLAEKKRLADEKPLAIEKESTKEKPSSNGMNELESGPLNDSSQTASEIVYRRSMEQIRSMGARIRPAPYGIGFGLDGSGVTLIGSLILHQDKCSLTILVPENMSEERSSIFSAMAESFVQSITGVSLGEAVGEIIRTRQPECKISGWRFQLTKDDSGGRAFFIATP